MVREIKRTVPAPPRRNATYGLWVQPAWAVRRLVEAEGWKVCPAVREIVHRCKFTQPTAFNSIRGAYYEVRKLPWSTEP